MVLNETNTYMQVLGSIMKDPTLLAGIKLTQAEFSSTLPRIIYIHVSFLAQAPGIQSLNPYTVDQEILRSEIQGELYKKNGGTKWLMDAYEISTPENFKYYYDRLRKLALLRELKKAKYDISFFYKEDFANVEEERATIERFDLANVEDILLSIETKFAEIRHEFTAGTNESAEVSEGIDELIQSLKERPEVGMDLEGAIFTTATRGARLGKFYLRSGSSGCGKSRLAVFDSCKICFPERWSHKKKCFIWEGSGPEKEEGFPLTKEEITKNSERRDPRRVLMITTEMPKDEIQTIILAYISGVNEEKLLMGKMNREESIRIQKAAEILKKYSEYYHIESISDPNLSNVQATIKKHIAINGVQYVFYDYIFSSPSLLTQFSSAKIREDVALMLLSNQLKEIAKEYNIFISSSTQVNAEGMSDGFKGESCLRGSKAIADKCDVGCVISRVTEKDIIVFNQANNRVDTGEQSQAAEAIISKDSITHIIDIYKMRRGRYKMVRIWAFIDLGTGERKEYYMTTSDHTIIQLREKEDIITQTHEWTNELLQKLLK